MARLPHLSLAFAVLAGLLLMLARWRTASGPPEPGDDTAFNLMLAAPVAFAIGLILASIAKTKGFGPPGLATLALLVNGGLLTGLLALAAFGIATYPGR